MGRVAMISLHTSPLTQPGSGDGGGMNVYVRELVGALAQAGVHSDVFVRRWRSDLPETIEVEPGFRVVHVDAGPPDLPKEQLAGVVEAFTDGVLAQLLHTDPVDAVHGNYWLSGEAAHLIKHELELPLVSTFHTLARVKADNGDPEPLRRAEAEARIIGCSDVILASCETEVQQLCQLYGADRERIEIVPPGVDHAFFSPVADPSSPGARSGARSALGLGDHPVLLFVGRIQPLKRVDVAVEALAHLGHPDAVLLVVGGASGAEGPAELARVRAKVAELGLGDRVRFVDPQPHHLLSTYYRAADAVIVPSRSESFGLVALEAAACGTPVVAAAVGGLRTLVDHGRTGFLVEGGSPEIYGAYLREIVTNPALAGALSVAAAKRARGYTWPTAAARLRRIYSDLAARAPVRCS